MEVWKDIPGCKGKYKISTMGKVKSLDRYVWNRFQHIYKKGRILKPSDLKDYLRVNIDINGKRGKVKIHKLMQWVFFNNYSLQIDHINGIKTDNRLINLRLCTHQQNMCNVNGKKSTSKFKGVYRRKNGGKPWRSSIGYNFRTINIGSFDDEIEAAKAYDKFAIKYHGEFARLNFPEGAHNEK